MEINGRVLRLRGPAYVSTRFWGWMMRDTGVVDFIVPESNQVIGARLVLRWDGKKSTLHFNVNMQSADYPSPMENDFTLAVISIYPDGRILTKNVNH